MPTSGPSFKTLDYILFALTLCISTAIGLFYAFRSWRNNAGVDDYLTGSRRMPLLPTAMSLLASFISGISIISYPPEVYTHGLVFFWFPISAVIAVVFSGIFILPVLYPMRNNISVYAYFEYRFNSPFLRSYVAVLYQLTILVYVSVVLYTPSIALANVTGIDVPILIVTVGLVCTMYTAIGGLKAVVWTDFFQVFIMYAGLLALAIKGTMTVGGFSRVFEKASKYDRIQGILNVDPNPFQYMTVWTALFGGFFYWLTSFGPSQTTLQRYCSLPTIRKARITIFLNVPCLLFMMLLILYIGLTMVAKYADCDPRLIDKSMKKDQLLLSFMMDTLDDVRGLPGLFVACIFSATLSSVSSGINSLCAVFLEDIVKPLTKKRPLTESRATLITKLIGALYGLLAIGLAFAAGPLGGIFNAAVSAIGVISGPIIGMFLLGIIFPCANSVGTLAGSAIGLIASLWVFIGASVHKVKYPQLPSDIAGCAVQNFTYEMVPPISNTTGLYSPNLDGIEQIYAVSNIMYSCIGAVLTILPGLVISMATGGSRMRNTKLTCWAKPDDDGRRGTACRGLLETRFEEKCDE